MKIEKKKLFLLSLFIIPILLITKVYLFDLYKENDTNTIAILTTGNGELISKGKIIILDKNQQIIVSNGDSVKSIGEDSLLELRWGDGSVTRLGGDSELLINNSFISKDLNKINIDIELLKGRTWSNIKSILGSKSYFKETGGDTIAAIRGTVFSMDLDNDYMKVIDHKVNLYNKFEGTKDVYAGEAFSISTVRRIELKKFLDTKLKKQLDDNWESLNERLDKEYLGELLKNIKAKTVNSNPLLSLMEVFSPKYRAIYEIDNSNDLTKLKEIIKGLDNNDREYVREYLLYKYQDINFVGTGDELFTKKIAYKEILTELSSNSDKVILVNSSVYDLEDSILNNNKDALELISSFINNNDLLVRQEELKVILKNAGGSKYINEELKEVLYKNFEGLKEFIDIDNISLDDISNSVQNKLNGAKEGLNKFLDDNVGDKLNNLLNK